ncbi:TonB-dependent receptor [Halocola ammonii]
MAQKLLLTLTLLLAALGVFSQATGTLTGVVTDGNDDPIVGASVYIKSRPSTGTYTDEDGRYELTLAANYNYTVVYSYTGRKVTREVNLKSGQELEIDVSINYAIDVGVADVVGRNDREKPMQTIDPKIYNKLPTPGGGIEALLRTTIANTASELSSAYSVRGGSFDENLVYVNDIQVYRPFLVRAGQQEGLSFPNPDMVENIEFSAGGFEAKYGDRMSSVLDIQYRKPKEFGGTVSAGLLGGSAHVEGVSKNKRFTHNTGFRYKSNSYLLNSLDTQGDYDPNYTDLQTYLTYEVSPILDINFLGNYSRNQYNFVPSSRETNLGTINEALRFQVDFEGQEVTEFETFFGAISANYQPNEFTMLRFIGSAFQTYESETFDIIGSYRLDELERDLGSDEFGEVLRNRGIGSFINHARNSLDARVLNFTHKGSWEIEQTDHFVQWGARYQHELINDRISEWDLIDSAGFASPHPPDFTGNSMSQEIPVQNLVKAENTTSSSRLTAYLQDSYSWENDEGAEFTANLGVRGHYWDFNNQFVGGPRANFSYKPKWSRTITDSLGNDSTISKDIVFTAAGGYYWQPPFYREMRGLDGSINEDIKAQQAIHAVVGADYIFSAWNRPFKLKAELYYKDLNYLIPYEVENVRLRYFATNNSRGYATGLDVMLNGEFVRGVQSWLRASFLTTQEDLLDDSYTEYYNEAGEQIIPGVTQDPTAVDSTTFYPGFVPRPTDQTFSFSMFFQDEMPRWPEYKVQLLLYFATGLPFGPPTFDRYNDTERTPPYRRVDVGFSRDLITEKNKNNNWFTSTFEQGWISLEVFNLLGINNTINYTWIEDVNGLQYSVPNFLTGRRVNLKLVLQF